MALSMTSDKLYGTRPNGKAHGDVFTSNTVVKYMLDLLGYTPDKDLSGSTILEPSCGDGAFIIEILERLKSSSMKYGFNIDESFHACVYAFDIDKNKIENCTNKIRVLYPEITDPGRNIRNEDFLTSKTQPFDYVVGNPPYVRYEQIPQDKIRLYKKTFGTFYYRSDLYIPFYEKSLSLLNKGGHHCFICSNRWQKNIYGTKLRQYVNLFRMEKVINMEGANVFQEDVLAYPSIVFISNNPPAPFFRYSEVSDINKLSNICDEKLLRTPERSEWSDTFNSVSTKCPLFTIEELKFKIGIGVATGADKIFISKNLRDTVENELLLPAINAKDLSGNGMHWAGEYLLNPYQSNGELVDLSSFPLASSYLYKEKSRLLKRHVARKNPEKWYKTIDRICPHLLEMPKILLPDITGNSYIFVDDGNFYPLHNIYYITGGDVQTLKILSAILMSDFVKKQLRSITNNMNGGYPRWQSQYIKKLSIPDIRNIKNEFRYEILSSYERHDLDGINNTVEMMLNEPSTNYSQKRKSNTPKQLQLYF